MTQKKIDIVIKDKSNDYHIHFFITRDEAVRYKKSRRKPAGRKV